MHGATREVFLSLLILVGLALSCAGRVPRGWLTSRDRTVETCSEHGSDTASLTYLGSGGFLLERDDDAILTAPFFTNPGIGRVVFGLPLRPDVKRIRAGVDAYLQGVEAVDAILAGHSHYDHLLDIPYILEEQVREGTIYGNQTMLHLLAPAVPPDRMEAVNDRACQWIPIGDHGQVMPLESGHAAHFLGIKLFKGKLTEDRKRLPRSAYGWKEGQSYAFLIDLGRDFRVHYQDAASRPPQGFPPDTASGRRVDVAIVTVASFSQTKRYPDEIIKKLNPRHVVLGHWEDFFRDPTKPPKVVRGTKLKNFVKRLEAVLSDDASWTLPKPGVILEFNVCRAGTPPQ